MALGSNIKKRTPQSVAKGETEQPQSTPAEAATGEAKKRSKRHKEVVVSKRSVHIIFPVGKEVFAVPIALVKEVIATPPIAHIPQSPEHFLGIANVRGNAIAVIDMGIRAGLEESEASNGSSYLLVINSDEFDVAIKVAKVPDTMTIEDDQVEVPSNMLFQSSKEGNFVKGIIKRGADMILLVDILEMIRKEETLL